MTESIANFRSSLLSILKRHEVSEAYKMEAGV
jgi:hypothetical protein